MGKSKSAFTLAGRGLKVDYRSVWAFVHAEKLGFKKPFWPASRIAPPSREGGSNGANVRIGLPRRLVFIDETWTRTNMTRLRGWSPCYVRLKAKAPFGHWKTMTFLTALRRDRIDAPWLLDGPINSRAF